MYVVRVVMNLRVGNGDSGQTMGDGGFSFFKKTRRF